MTCVVCDEAETILGTINVSLERDHLTYTLKNVPVQICPKCGEAYADEIVTANLLHEAEKMVIASTKIFVQEYRLV